MDKNSTIGLVLISLILIAYFFYNTQKAQQAMEQAGQGQVTDSTVRPTTPNETSFEAPPGAETLITEDSLLNGNPDSLKALKLSEKYGAFAQAATGEAQNYTLENEDVRIAFTSHGAEMIEAELKHYKTYDKQPLMLFNEGDNKKSLNFPTLNSNVFTSDLYFTTTGVQQTAKGQAISFVAKASGGGSLVQTYTLAKEGYLMDYDVELIGLENVIPNNASYLNLVWSQKLPKQEKDKTFEDRYTALYFKYLGDDVENLSETGNEEETPTGSLEWISYKQQFFNTTLMGKDSLLFKNVKLQSASNQDPDYLKDFNTQLILPYTHSAEQRYAMQYYLGPNHYQTLKKMGNDMENIINLGTGIMSFIAVFSKYLIIPVFNFLERYISNYGWIILILTVLIKIVILPLSYKSYLSAAKMKVIKPEMDELKAKYADDQSKFAQEQMKLYSKAGVNPLGGCIPQLIPFPILLAMYYFFPSSIELRQESFLWATDLSTYDSILNLPFTIPFYGSHVSLFTILMAVTSLVYTLTNSQMQGASMEGPMKYMPYFIPVMLLGVFNSFPAALSYYYLLQNLTSMGQQAFIQKFFIDEEALHKQIQENKKKKPKEGGGGFADRLKKVLEEQNKKQQAEARKKKK